MARKNLRNFINLFRAVEVDDAEQGPEVSDDIQLVYVADDLRQTSYIYGGSGGSEAAVAGEHGMISLNCRVRRGIEIQQVTMTVAAPADGTVLRAWTSGVQPVNMTGPTSMLTALRTTGLQGLPAAPLSIADRGTLPTASIPATSFNWVDVHGFTPPFFINQGQFFNVVFQTANTAVDLGIRWREMRLFP